jgi:primosomal protein N' (replication factor Y)
VVLVQIIPATSVPLGKPQHFTYRIKNEPPVGQVVTIPLGRRTLRGVALSLSTATQIKNIREARAETWRLPAHSISLAERLARYYRVPLGLVIKLMLPPVGPLTKTPIDSTSTPLSRPTLAAQQAQASTSIQRALGSFQKFLLHGVTGSGKTEVYVDVASKVLQKGGQVLLLVPEISMTSQVVTRLQSFFSDRVVVWHSGRTSLERRKTWARALSGEPLVVIGSRSALFVPLPKLGLVVVDEEHDGSYKQFDQEPRYHTRIAVQLLARAARCPLVLASATPSLESLHAVWSKRMEYLVLSKRFGGAKLPQIDLVDVRGTPRGSILSEASRRRILQAIDDKKQVIVLINRRGLAPVLLCRDCGHISRCPHCSRTLTVHTQPQSQLACHFCEQTLPMPNRCEKCSSATLITLGIGTERVVSELEALLPQSRIERLDRDIARSRAKLGSVSRAFMNGDVDVLVGTQLVAKGWDVARLSLVVVLGSDMGLLVPDFRAHERTVQLLWQVAGRAGRRKEVGHVLIETHFPDHPVLKAVQTHRYLDFAKHELDDRKRFGWPPYRNLVTISVSEKQINDLALLRSQLSSLPKSVEVELFPIQRVVRPRGEVLQRMNILCKDLESVKKMIPLHASIDINPEQLI